MESIAKIPTHRVLSSRPVPPNIFDVDTVQECSYSLASRGSSHDPGSPVSLSHQSRPSTGELGQRGFFYLFACRGVLYRRDLAGNLHEYFHQRVNLAVSRIDERRIKRGFQRQSRTQAPQSLSIAKIASRSIEGARHDYAPAGTSPSPPLSASVRIFALKARSFSFVSGATLTV